MSISALTSLIFLISPFLTALLWARISTSEKLSAWLKKSVIWGAPSLAILLVVIKGITSACTHEANFGFTECTTIPVSFANASMTGFVLLLMLLAGYGLALFGVGVAVELQTRWRAKR